MKENNVRFTLKTKALMLLGIVVVVSLCMAGYTVILVRDEIIMLAIEKLKSDSATSMAIFNDKYPGEWSIRDGKLFKGDTQINENHEWIDRISEMTGNAVTIFQTDTRIATTVRTSSGDRALGTRAAEKVVDAVLKNGHAYIGKADVAGMTYQTSYEPIKNSSGEVIGMFFVGVSNTRFEGDVEEVTRGFVRVNIKNLFPDSGLFFDVYFPVADHDRKVVMQRVLSRGTYCDRRTQRMLADKGFQYFYVRQEDTKAFDGYLQANAKSRLSAPDVTPAEKAEILYGSAEYIVEKAFVEGRVEEALPQGVAFAKEAAKQFSRSRMTSGELLKIFSKDYNTFTHSIQVSLLGMAFCLYLGYSEKETADFGLGALFHDIGKSEVDNDILNKPSRLTAEEFELMKEHPLRGYERLSRLNLLTHEQLMIVLQHHEDVNGGGYPQGLKSQDIHPYAKITRIVDTYDALTTRRSYKDAFPSAQAFQLMETEMKPLLDAQLLKSFWVFMRIRERSVDRDRHIDLSLRIGSVLHIKLSDKAERLPAKLIGMDAGAYLIVQPQNPAKLFDQVFKGKEVVVRYISDGTIFGFESRVMDFVMQPVRLLFLTYPSKIQSCEIREHKRFDCLCDAKLVLAGVPCRGVVANISMGGCLFVTEGLDEEQSVHIKVEDSVTLSFEPPAGAPVEALTGEVRNIRRSNGRVAEIGIRFLDLPDDTRNVLIDCLRNLAVADRLPS